MEKPSPTYDISSRLLSNKQARIDASRGFYDRMVLRDIPVLSDNDDQEKKPIWRGDHNFSVDAATYSLTNFIEPEVARAHPDWTSAQIHEQAMERFQKRLAQDLSYERSEMVHEESALEWKSVETKNGIELATTYGDKMVTLSELWEHTKEFSEFVGNPAAYNADEHRAQLQMQEELINGSSNGFVSVLSHPDAIRYVQIWQKSDSGTIVSRHVDLFATTGRDFSPEEATQLIFHLSSFHKERTSDTSTDATDTHAHFFVTQGTVDTYDIRTIAMAQALYLDTSSESKSEIRESRPVDMLTHVVHDTKGTAAKFGLFIRDQIQEKIQQVKQRGIEKKVSPDKKITANVRIKTEKKEHTNHVDTNEHRNTVESVDMKSLVSEWWVTRTMVQFIDQLPVAPAASLFWFSMIQEVGLPLTRNESSDRIRTILQPRKMIDLWKKFVSDITASFLQPRHSGNVPTSPAPEPAIATPVDMPVHNIHAKEAEIRIDDSTISRWYEVIRVLSQAFSRDLSEGTDIPISMPKISEKFTRENVHRFVFAYMLWQLCAVARHQVKRRVGLAMMPGGATRELDEKEEIPWILLSIIWQLSMVKEAAMQGTQPVIPQKSTRPIRTKKRSAFLGRGIIFTFAS